MKLREIKTIFHKELDPLYPKEEIDSFFYMLIEHYLNLERFVLALQPEVACTKDEEQPLFEALSELRLLRPIQHIIGKVSFMDLELIVNQNVLIPRPETEELVRWIIQDKGNIEKNTHAKRKLDGCTVLDIGTGSGCIAIALAKQFEAITVFAMDNSALAIDIAKKNAASNSVEINFLQADIFKFESKLKFDIIVSNPPYVRESEKSEMHKNVLNHEPEVALFVSNENPLLFYNQISKFAAQHLKPNGRLFFEINQYLGKETQQLLQDQNFSEIELKKDMFGADRMLKGVFVRAIV